jgi:hypothetical protein
MLSWCGCMADLMANATDTTKYTFQSKLLGNMVVAISLYFVATIVFGLIYGARHKAKEIQKYFKIQNHKIYNDREPEQ